MVGKIGQGRGWKWVVGGLGSLAVLEGFATWEGGVGLEGREEKFGHVMLLSLYLQYGHK